MTLELKYLQKVFKEYNNYPHWFITQVFNDVNKIFNQQQEVIVTNETTTAEESNSIKQIVNLPYADEKGCSIVKSLKKHLKKTLPANLEADIIYTSTFVRIINSNVSNIRTCIAMINIYIIIVNIMIKTVPLFLLIIVYGIIIAFYSHY